ncbi:MAG: radical SAM protein [Syntrophaceae bacterium]|nr:radical SAM protein [Syntrophaceae bacterium]
MPSENKFITLTPHTALKNLEKPYLYDIQNDEIYELNSDAYQFLLKLCRGEKPSVRKEDEAFIQFCLSENLIAFSETPLQRKMPLKPSPIPSLRYLELQITNRCNLQCRHCYLGESSHRDLSLKRIQKVLEEFEEIQGLRLLLSGGEPLLHPHFWEMNDILRNYPFRSVLLSNGTLITEEVAKRLRVHEVQISLDGMREGHETLRGKGTFEKTMMAIDHLQKVNLKVSVATMIHRKNLSEFDQLASFIKSKNIEEWNVDVPCVEGRLKANQEFWVSPSEAGHYLGYGYGGGFHGSKNNFTCGAHLCAIMVDGTICKCGLFSEEPVGSIEESLRKGWERVPRILLKDLTCKCPVMEECRGGCRYRAKVQGDLFQPDLFQCYARGILKGGE